MCHQPKLFLFVPASRPERIAKAFACGADEVIVDWEDAIGEDKAAGRRQTAEYCAQADARLVWVRINGAASAHHAEDLLAAAVLPNLQGIVLGKTESAAEIEQVFLACGKPVLADIESARGMAAVYEIARAQGLFAMTYGCLDLANDLRLTFNTPAADLIFDRLRTDLLLASRINNLHAPIETTLPEFKQLQIMADYMQRWLDMGFGGVLCIHPQQVAAALRACRPSEEEMAFAAKVVVEAERSGAAVFQVDGRMVDAPVIARAKQLLAQQT